MDLGLAGKRVLITGGTRGIGRAIAETFLAEGAHVALCARSQGGLQAMTDQHGSERLLCAALDVRDGERLKAWIADSAQTLDGLDCVVSNVSTRLETTGESLWRDTFETDLVQHVRLSEAVLPWLQKSQGALTFISSIASVLTHLPPGEEAYGAAKAALVNYAGQLAARNGPKGVRVNTVSPGPILFDGGFWDGVRVQQPQLFQAAAQLPALRRHGHADEVAKAVVFLASPAASYVTGANLRIDGGAVKTANF